MRVTAVVVLISETTASYCRSCSRSRAMALSSRAASNSRRFALAEPRSILRSTESNRCRCSSLVGIIGFPLAQKCSARLLTENRRASWSHVKPLRRRNSAIAAPDWIPATGFPDVVTAAREARDTGGPWQALRRTFLAFSLAHLDMIPLRDPDPGVSVPRSLPVDRDPA